MRLNHSEPVLGLDGKPVTEPGSAKPLTFKDLAIHALSMEKQQENLGAEKKAKCFQTMLKFLKGKKVTLTAEEAALIKERAGATLGIQVFGRLCEWIEGNPPVVEDESDEGDDSDQVTFDKDD